MADAKATAGRAAATTSSPRLRSSTTFSARRSSSPTTRATMPPARACRRSSPSCSRRSTRARRSTARWRCAHRGNRRQDLEAARRDPPPPGFPASGVGLARSQVRRSIASTTARTSRREVLNCSKDDLIADFEDAPEIVKSGLYRPRTRRNTASSAASPTAPWSANYEIEPGAAGRRAPPEVRRGRLDVARPVLRRGGPEVLRHRQHPELPNLKDIKALMEGPQYTKWNSSARRRTLATSAC